MDANKREHFRKLLEKRLHELDHTLDIMKENNTSEQDKYSPSELSNYDNHPAELGTELFLVQMNSALKVHEENILQDIKDALDKINDGTYGKCLQCNSEIPEERLEVLPYAKLCIKCKDENESSPNYELYKGKGRANEELVLDAPMGRKYLNKQEDDEFEGMDQFNDLMKYGSSDSPQDLGGYRDYEDFFTNEVDQQGIVDDMDRISNEEYKKQLPD
jgi:YteA family regulatory protein